MEQSGQRDFSLQTYFFFFSVWTKLPVQIINSALMQIHLNTCTERDLYI